MVPLPAQGHLNQLLQLSRLISSYDIPVHYVGTTTHNRQARLRVHGWNPLATANIHFHEFPTPSFLTPPPNPNSSNKFPSQLVPSFQATWHLREPVATLLRAFSAIARRIIVIHDVLTASVVQDVASIPNAEAYDFKTTSAFATYWYIWERAGKPYPIDAEIMKDAPSSESCFTSDSLDFIASQRDCRGFSSGHLYNACKVIETPYLDLLEKEQMSKNKKQWAIGPFNPVAISENNRSKQRHECLEWLDKQAHNSVIFVSFGTTTSLSDEQIKELAIGLEKSEQKFIWVLRDADKADVFEGEVRRAELPKGFEDRVEGKGMVVRDWAPQLEILGHPSTGGFMSHCGWNSCMESMTMGVPIAAWPMHSDQPRNTLLITKVLKLGIVVKDWARQGELVTSLMVEETVKRLMASKEGDEIRKRAAELGGAVRQSVAEAQGHLNQLLQLSRLISSYDIPVHYVGTTTHNRQARLRVHGWNPLATANIHFHELPTPSFLTPPPNPNSSNKFPSQLLPSLLATSHLREPVATLLRALSPTARRVIVIHDDLMASVVQDVTSVPNAESYNFQSISAFATYWFDWEFEGKPFPIDAEILKEAPSSESCFTSDFWDFATTQSDFREFNCGNIYNTSKVIESPYLDLLEKEETSKNKKQWAIGPFNLVAISDDKKSNQRHKSLKWLDKQAPNTVIFVSFGTTTSLSDEQIKELAIGLEKSEQKFIWVLRDADKGDVFEGEVRRAELPEGFEERLEGKGMVVRDWAPQLEILGHPSTGGFMSHCGWNSCMESITMGVPIAAWPMHSDQPRNAVLVTKVLKVGVVVKDWARQGELVTSLTVEEAVKRLMASKEGDDIRKRAAELGGAVRQSVAEGGVSRMELDSFIAHITR
ncbi:hypothetical protein F0562_017422 [Nyssa sinensis]|uniref:Glycosyltransferase N-terminal domain-containing protein n=1 Tax=Nyssa sinensis TaxID=561372 RepID=A0A5J4ZGJ9_9ASTE|nr:hypothetical protein F0562_017422 [Nyssa sinensis]